MDAATDRLAAGRRSCENSSCHTLKLRKELRVDGPGHGHVAIALKRADSTGRVLPPVAVNRPRGVAELSKNLLHTQNRAILAHMGRNAIRCRNRTGHVGCGNGVPE